MSHPSLPDNIKGWLQRAIEQDASDVHLVPGHHAVLRIHGDLKDDPGLPVDVDTVTNLMAAVCPDEVSSRLRQQRNVDFSFETPVGGLTQRFRANAFFTDDRISACLRLVPSSIPDFEWAGFPHELGDQLAALRDGLVIVTGMTGSGKTTTLAMVVNEMNQYGRLRIITVEEPVEYRYPKAANSMVTQREVGIDVVSFSEGLRSGLRQDPDVILIGEIRDRETAQMCLSAAETGHVVFTTLHTRDSKGAISRYADLFPQDVQSDIRSQLAINLKAVISQRLLPDVVPGNKRHLALEILWNSPPIASAIRQGKLESIDNYLLTRRDDGMLSFDESIRQLLRAGKISREVAEKQVRDISMLNR